MQSIVGPKCACALVLRLRSSYTTSNSNIGPLYSIAWLYPWTADKPVKLAVNPILVQPIVFVLAIFRLWLVA